MKGEGTAHSQANRGSASHSQNLLGPISQLFDLRQGEGSSCVFHGGVTTQFITRQEPATESIHEDRFREKSLKVSAALHTNFFSHKELGVKSFNYWC